MERILPSTRDWPLFNIAASRRIEARGQPSPGEFPLMQRAGAAVARLAMAVAPHARRVWIAAGPGNNGGDGFESAIRLSLAGREVDVGLLGDPATLPADARAAFARAREAGVRIHVAADVGAWPSAAEPIDLVLDALLGIGANRPPAGPLAVAIDWLNARGCPVLAVDLPSGLNADTGQPFDEQHCVVATHTLSLLTLRPGLFTGSGRDQAGTVWLDTLGVASAPESASAQLSASRPRPSARRRHGQNKGSFGDVIVVGGATGMTGGALLASRAALAAGAGRVYLHLLQPAGTAMAVDVLRPELMFRADDLLDDREHLARATVVCGCGGGDAVGDVLPRLFEHAGRLVLDADGLNAVSKAPALAALLADRAGRGRPTVLTPHPLEAARLLGRSTADLQADRLAAARQLVERFRCQAVLKGSGSIVAGPGKTPHVNASGNASLATAGTGDVLAGWMGGLWAQRKEAGSGFEVAVQAVAEHGAAADPEVPGSLRAGDLIEALRHRQR